MLILEPIREKLVVNKFDFKINHSPFTESIYNEARYQWV